MTEETTIDHWLEPGAVVPVTAEAVTLLVAECARLRAALAAAEAVARKRAVEVTDMALYGEPSHARRREGMGAAFTEMACAIQLLHAEAVASGALAARAFGGAEA